MEYIINECSKQAENYKRRSYSPKKERKEQEIKEKEKEGNKQAFIAISNENNAEEKKEQSPISHSEDKIAAEQNNNSNILNKIIDSIDEDHELDDKDIDQYINSKD